MKNSTRRWLALALVASIAIPSALVARTHVAAHYQRVKAAYQNQLTQKKMQAQAEAQTRNNERQNERDLAALQAAVKAKPGDIQRHWQYAQKLQEMGRLAEALPQLREIARLDPGSASAAVAIANTLLYLHRFPEAARAYRGITQRWPKSVDGWQGLAAVFYHERLYNEAGAASQQALRLDPKDFGNRYVAAASGIEYALEFPDAPETQPALAVSRKLLTQMVIEVPNNGDLQYKKGLAEFLSHNTNGSLPYLRRAADLLPEHDSVIYDLAEILNSVGRYDEARALLLRSIPRTPKSAGLYNLLSETYQYDSAPTAVQEALRASKTATQLAPNTPRYWDRLALNYLRAQDFTQARQTFETSLKLDPNRSYPYQQLAALYSRLGQSQRATVAAQMASRMETNDESLRHLESLSAQYPGDINLLLVRADRYRDLKMYGPARDLYRQILTLQPESAAAAQGLTKIAQVWPPPSEAR